MANLFKDLPHLVGTITNLDKAQSMRALESINAELKKRQRLFAKYNVNHINAYQKFFKEGKAEEPMPHLFMISDEFAELKSEQPDFMDELISTARIGRSLGVHLILATQKPAGVVNDQIWSNSNFKISLKVSDKEDSMEVLKTPDAANITLPGRAYLEVGNNEMYELFQSAYSGADYRPDEDDSNQSFLIKKINKMGQQQVISQDLSGLDETGHVEKVPTQLEAVVNKVHDLFEESGAKPLAQPWLPPLRKWISITELDKRDFHEEWNKPKEPLKAVIGQVDIPSEQAQRPVSVDLTEDGNLAVFASAGNGKSTFLQTLIMQLARTHTPEELNIYLLDFGTNGLMPLRKLPHVADTIQIDEEEKLRKFIVLIKQEIKKRQKILSQKAVSNIEMYEATTGESLPRILVVIDNLDGCEGIKLEETFRSMLSEIARNGLGLGIHLVLTASMVRVLRLSLMNSIKSKIALKQNTSDDLMNIVGKTKKEIADIPGRGLISLEEPLEFQVALPTDGNDDLTVIDNLRNTVDDMNDSWEGYRPVGIPMMPDEIEADEFFKRQDVAKAINENKLPMGLDYENVEAVVYDPEMMGNIAVMADQTRNLMALKHAVFTSLLKVSAENKSVLIADSDNFFKDRPQEVGAFYQTEEELKKFKDNLLSLIRNNQDKNWFYVLITDMEKFINTTGISYQEVEEILRDSINSRVALIVVGTNAHMSQRIDPGTYYRQYLKTGIFASRKQDQKLYEVMYDMNEPDLEENSAYFNVDRRFIKLKFIK